jgi:DNA sulfur modification protein DndD
MNLISITLCNFRQFYGKSPEIKLASGRAKYYSNSR